MSDSSVPGLVTCPECGTEQYIANRNQRKCVGAACNKSLPEKEAKQSQPAAR